MVRVGATGSFNLERYFTLIGSYVSSMLGFILERVSYFV